MNILLEIVGPVFLLLAAGYIAVYTGFLTNNSGQVLSKYAAGIAVPCLLFRSIAGLDLALALDVQILSIFYGVGFFCFLLTMKIARRYFNRRPGESVSVGFSVLFGNSVFLGLTLTERAYGDSGEAIAYGIVGIHAMAMYIIGSVAMESVSVEGKGSLYALKQSVKSLSMNPLVIGIVAGFVANIANIQLPSIVGDSMDLLAKSALPVGLFSIGAALTQYKIKEELGESIVCAGIKLIIFPVLVLLLTYAVALEFPLPFESARVAILLASLPAGINIYLFAAYYKRAEALAASVLLISTIVSILTMSLWLAILEHLAVYWPSV